MCRYIAEGRQYQKCNHFVRLHVIALYDCGSRVCTRSIQHPRSCRCQGRCTSSLGPEIQRPVVSYDEFCWACQSTGVAAAASASSTSVPANINATASV